MYRSLSNYSDSYRYASYTQNPNALSTVICYTSPSRTRDIELTHPARDPYMLPIEVTVHKERHQEESRLQFGHGTTVGTDTTDSKYGVGEEP